MSLSESAAQALWREGAQALRSGDTARALKAFRDILESGRDDPSVWFAVAMASRQAGDRAAMLEALDAVLARAPRDIRALMMKGDHFAAVGDRVGATSFYRAVSQLGDKPGWDPALRPEVDRARAESAAATRLFEEHLLAELETAGLDHRGARRVKASIDMMLGRRPVMIQQPTQYLFPEMPQIEFYDREDTPWLAEVERATSDIRDELLAVLEDKQAFTPYHEPTPHRPMFDRDRLIGSPNWTAFHLVKGGHPVGDHAARCPGTMAAVEKTPLCRIPGKTPSILFSLLRPGARIPPHHGMINTRLICHLPLIVPPNCGFRVGAQTRAWREGEAFAFDDTIEHEAWNNSAQTRVVLIFDVWQPALSDRERALVSKVVQASESFSGSGELPV